MKKYLLLSLIFIGVLFAAIKISNAQTLYDCFREKELAWTTVLERSELAAKYGVWQYKGTAAQNTLLASRLCEKSDLIGFSVITDYSSTLNLPMTSSQTTVPVSSLLTKDLHTITASDFGSKVFLTIEPGGSKQELVMCTGITGSTFSGCTRGLAFFGTSTASVAANQKTHSPGSRVIMSNSHYVYEQFLDVNDKDQTIQANKTFASGTIFFTNGNYGIRESGGRLQWSVDGFVNSYNFTSSTISQLQASSTLGIQVVDSLIGILASTTQGMAFGSDGRLYQKTSSTLGVYADLNGISINTSTLSALFTSFPNAATSTPIANKIPVADSNAQLNSWVTGDRLVKINSASSTLTGTQTQTLLASTTLSANSLTTSTVYKIKINISNHTVANPITDSFVLKLGGIGIVTTTFSGASANPSVAGTIEATIYTVSSTAQKGVLSVDMMTTPISALATTNGFVEKSTAFGTASQNTANSLDFGIYYTGSTVSMTIDSYEITKLQL